MFDVTQDVFDSRVSDLVPAITATMDAGLNAMVWGAPGIGKSDLVRQIADARGLPVIDIRASTIDPVDLRGLPAAEDGKAVWLPMGELPCPERDGPAGVLFLDEINTGAAMVQAAMLGLTLDRYLGAYELPEGWHIIAAGNRQSDKASANRMSSALGNRFVHFGLAANVDDWTQWALASGVSAEVIQFIRFRPEALHDFDPDRTVNATPRSWAMADKLVKQGLPPAVELATICGTVGQARAAELIGFLKVWRSLPSPDSIFQDPRGAAIPDKSETLFALCGALARKVTASGLAALVIYLDRIAPEFAAMTIGDAVKLKPELENTREVIAWRAANSGLYT